MKLQSLPTFLVRRKNWLLMAALALSLTAALLLRPSSPQAQRVTLPMTSAESSASPLEAFRISRDSAYQRDMAALETLISSENADRAARQSAAEELQAYVALPSGAVSAGRGAADLGARAVLRCGDGRERHHRDGKAGNHGAGHRAGADARTGAYRRSRVRRTHHDGAVNFVKSLFHFAKSGVYCLCQESAD